MSVIYKYLFTYVRLNYTSDCISMQIDIKVGMFHNYYKYRNDTGNSFIVIDLPEINGIVENAPYLKR